MTHLTYYKNCVPYSGWTVVSAAPHSEQHMDNGNTDFLDSIWGTALGAAIPLCALGCFFAWVACRAA